MSRHSPLLALLLLAGCAGVHRLVPDTPVRVGRPYAAAGRTWVPADDRGYDAIGEASWYGGAEQGHPTANGERFDRRRVSAAHKTLPLPSYVEVTRLDTGTRMVVRVNDRGPFARDRVIDLSREAARDLGMDRAGRALVRVRRVQPSRAQAMRLRRGYPVMLASVAPTASPPGTGPAPRPPALPAMPLPPLAVPPAAVPIPVAPPVAAWRPRPEPPPRPVPPVPPLSILVAVVDDPDAADALASTLAEEGARVVATGAGYRIVTGPYPDAATLAAALARLRARGYAGPVAPVAPVPSPADGPSTP